MPCSSLVTSTCTNEQSVRQHPSSPDGQRNELAERAGERRAKTWKTCKKDMDKLGNEPGRPERCCRRSGAASRQTAPPPPPAAPSHCGTEQQATNDERTRVNEARGRRWDGSRRGCDLRGARMVRRTGEAPDAVGAMRDSRRIPYRVCASVKSARFRSIERFGKHPCGLRQFVQARAVVALR